MEGCRSLFLTAAVITLIGCTYAFQETNKLLTSLDGVATEGAKTIMCFQGHAHPQERLEDFVTDTVDIYDGLTITNQRVGTINTVAGTILLIPGINALGAFVLIPLTTGLTWTSRGISSFQTGTEPIVNAMREWVVPLASDQADQAIQNISPVGRQAVTGATHIGGVAAAIAMVQCGATRDGLLANLENTAHGMDAIPDVVKDELKRSGVVCNDVKYFLDTTNNKIETEVTTTLSIAKASIDSFNTAMDPLQEYLDEVNKALDRRLCFSDVEDLLKLVPDYQKPIKEAVKEAAKAGNKAVKDVTSFFKRRFGRKRRNAPKEPVKKVMDEVVQTVESLADQAKTFWQNKFGRQARSVATVRGDRKRRDVCASVRQVLDGSIAVDGGYTAVAEFLVREVFNRVLPKLPGVTSDLTKLSATLLPFDTDFNFKQKSEELKPEQTIMSTFVSLDYESTFWEKPDQSDISTQQTCAGETALVIPS